MPVSEATPLEDSVRISRVEGKTLLEMAGSEPANLCVLFFRLQINLKVLWLMIYQIEDCFVCFLIFCLVLGVCASRLRARPRAHTMA